MGIGAQAQEVQQVVEIGLPVPLGIGIEGQVHPGEFPGEPVPPLVDHPAVLALVEHLDVVVVGLLGVRLEQAEHPGGLFPFEHRAPALPVGPGLGRQLVRRRNVELPVEHGIAGRVFVDVGGAVADPLPGDEDRHLDVVFDLAHLERRGVPVAQQIADQPPVGGHLPGPLAVGDPGRLHDGRVVAHVVDHPDEAVIEHRHRRIEQLLEAGDRDPAGLGRGGAGVVDFRLLFGRQFHVPPLPDSRRGEQAPRTPPAHRGAWNPLPTEISNPARSRAPEWTFMDIHGHSWTFMDIYGHLWTFMDIYGHLMTCLNSNSPRFAGDAPAASGPNTRDILSMCAIGGSSPPPHRRRALSLTPRCDYIRRRRLAGYGDKRLVE